MFQTSDNGQLCIDSQYSSQWLTIVWSLKHQNTQPIYIFSWVRVLHLDRLKEGTWLHSFDPNCPLASLAQCRKILMTPLGNIGRTRIIGGYFFYENLRPNQQLDVIEYGVLLQNLLKTLIFRVFSCYLPNQMKNFTLSRLFFHLYLASKGDQNTFYLFQSSN